jgi:hypothetical protein
MSVYLSVCFPVCLFIFLSVCFSVCHKHVFCPPYLFLHSVGISQSAYRLANGWTARSSSTCEVKRISLLQNRPDDFWISLNPIFNEYRLFFLWG